MLKLGFVVLCVGGCALGMLALRQAGLQAGHELAQTQLRIQKADEDLWKLRAEISTLAAPARIRELADKLGPLHGLTPRPEAGEGEGSTAAGPEIATAAQQPAVSTPKQPGQPPIRPGSKQSTKPKPEAKPQPKQPAKTDGKPPAPASGPPSVTKPIGTPSGPSSRPTAAPPRPTNPKPERNRAPGVA